MAPVINDFIDETGHVDINAWQHDICARLLVDMDNGGEGFTTRELCMIYFGYADMEKRIWMGDQMQAARLMLQDRATPFILRNNQYRWYIVKPSDMAGARGFIVDRAKRFIRSHSRLRRYSAIGQQTYALPAGDPLVQAIETVRANVQAIDAAIAPPPLPPSTTPSP